MNKIFKRAIVLFMVMIFAFGCMQVMAAESSLESTSSEEIPAKIQELIEKCSKLPIADDVTEEHGDLIIEVKQAYDSLERSDKALVGGDNITKITTAYNAYLPYLIGRIVEKLEALPKRIKDKHKDQLVDIYGEFSLLTDEEKDSLDPELVEKYMEGVKKVAPELLGEEAQNEEASAENKTEKTQILGMYIWELAVVIFLVLILCFNVFLIVFSAIKLFKEAKE